MSRSLTTLKVGSLEVGNLTQLLNSAKKADTTEKQIAATNVIMYFCGSKLRDPTTDQKL